MNVRVEGTASKFAGGARRRLDGLAQERNRPAKGLSQDLMTWVGRQETKLKQNDLPQDSSFDFTCLYPSALTYLFNCSPWRRVQFSSCFPLPLTQINCVISSVKAVLAK